MNLSPKACGCLSAALLGPWSWGRAAWQTWPMAFLATKKRAKFNGIKWDLTGFNGF